MPTNNGFLKEDEMVFYLNGKRYEELSNNLKNLITALYGVVDNSEIIKCEKVEGFIKPDFCIECKGEKKYVSMKSGTADIVHQEYVKNFVLFLRELGISNKTLQTILLYQYGDGTMDGSGKQRYDYEKLRLMLKSRIDEANKELNQSKDVIAKVIERCVYLGTLENAIEIDCLYHGNYEFGNVVTKRQIKKHLSLRNWDWVRNLHIGPLQLRPHARYINKEIHSEKRRNQVDIVWANLGSDIDYISKRYDY